MAHSYCCLALQFARNLIMAVRASWILAPHVGAVVLGAANRATVIFHGVLFMCAARALAMWVKAWGEDLRAAVRDRVRVDAMAAGHYIGEGAMHWSFPRKRYIHR